MSDTTFYQKLMALALNVFDAYSAVLFLPEPDSVNCRVAAYYSLGDDVKADVVISPGMGLAGWIVHNQKPLLVGNFDQKRGFLGYYDQKDEARIRAFMGCPVTEGGGAICLDSRKTFTFGEKDQKILGQFAEMAGAHAASERRQAGDRRDARYYQALATISGLRRTHPKWPAFQAALLRILSETSGFDFCFLAVRDESGHSYYLDAMNRSLFENPLDAPRKFTLGQGLIGWVFKNHSPAFVGDGESTAASTPLFGKDVAAAEFRSVICLPLTFARRTRAVLVLADEKPLGFGPEIQGFVRMASEYLVLFLENLHLKSRLPPSAS
ncbi:GAF domain-containing protein [Desulfolutivibrio sulfoxidireducens]|uniref:GAF domain-containing protein n=1 Tax=Desulfolutivibrio sulfoxidireducens TaxID=2773299 RepID=UPI00159DBB66|nr:GAF domain-containing protein [Desulfolutivibrio sulfoxidireducens]QLA16068.1 GAF domain-containing protein [Desulfolutivibrio sulfoxidireducens]QLA20022.1 GAF domain-containing protein [Desulfolutivibrio sulfoxidireducens]